MPDDSAMSVAASTMDCVRYELAGTGEEPPLPPEGAALAEGLLAGKVELVWSSPAGWPAPSAGFIPDPAWRPDPYWPSAPEDWNYWIIEGPSQFLQEFRRPLTLYAPSPDPVWVPAPGWPRPPESWTPPADWTPDYHWAPAPPDWAFWRQPPRNQEADLRVQVATRSDRLNELNILEKLMRSVADLRARTLSDELTRQLMRLPSRRDRKRLRGLAVDAIDATLEMLGGCRASLLHSLVHDSSASESFFAWKRTFPARIGNMMEAQRNAWGLTNPSESVSTREGLNRSLAILASVGESDDLVETGALAVGAAWQQAELLAVAALRQFGFTDARQTVGGADGGIDVQSSRIVAQVKYTSRPVGRPVLQQLLGAAAGTRTAFFSASGYSQHAKEFADARHVALFVIRLPNTVRAVNGVASELAQG